MLSQDHSSKGLKLFFQQNQLTNCTYMQDQPTIDKCQVNSNNRKCYVIVKFNNRLSCWNEGSSKMSRSGH